MPTSKNLVGNFAWKGESPVFLVMAALTAATLGSADPSSIIASEKASVKVLEDFTSIVPSMIENGAMPWKAAGSLSARR